MNYELKCRIIDHQEKIVFICTNINCQNQRGLCAICIKNELHNSDLNFDKDKIIQLTQFRNILKDKAQLQEASIKESEILIENFRTQFKNIQEQILQIIKKEESKIIDLKESKTLLDQYINQIHQQQIDNKNLSDIVAFYLKLQDKKIKDTKINTLLGKVNQLFKEYNQKPIKLLKKNEVQMQIQENQEQCQQNSVIQYVFPEKAQTINYQYQQSNPQNQTIYDNQQRISIITQPQLYNWNQQQIQQTKKCTQSVDHKQNIVIAQISPNNLMIASSDADNILLLWNTFELTADQKYSHGCLIRSLCFSDNSKYLFAGDDQGFIIVFDLNVGLKVQIKKQLSSSPIIAIFNTENNILIQVMNGHLYNCQYQDSQIKINSDFDTNHPYSEDDFLLSSRDYCNQSQIFAYTNQKTIYLWLQLFSNFQKLIAQQLDKQLGQIILQQNRKYQSQLNLQLITTFIDIDEIQIWQVGQQLIKQQSFKIDGFPLNMSVFDSTIIYETQNQLNQFSLEFYFIRKATDIPEQPINSHYRKFYDTKQSKDPSYHICLRSNVLILIKDQ